MAITPEHLEYWLAFAVPVMLVAYSPSLRIASWISIRDYVDRETYHARLPIKSIRLEFDDSFTVASLTKRISALAHSRADERILLRCADKCLSVNTQDRHDGFLVLTGHPDSRDLKIVCELARRLLLDESRETATEAMRALGYGVGRALWSWNPSSKEEADVIRHAHAVCETLTAAEAQRCLELIDEELFGGPYALGTYCYLVLQAAWHAAESVLYACIHNAKEPFERRLRAFWIYYDGETNDLLDSAEVRAEFLVDDIERDLYLAWFPDFREA